MRMAPELAFCALDPLLLLPQAPERGLLVGAQAGPPLSGFAAVDTLARSGPATDAVVALDWRESVEALLDSAARRLVSGGVLLARMPNRQLPPRLARRLYPGFEPSEGPGTSLAELRRTLRGSAFRSFDLYCWLPGESFPCVLYPADERRLQAFYLARLKPRWGLKGLLLAKLGRLLPPAALAPAFVLVARKGD